MLQFVEALFKCADDRFAFGIDDSIHYLSSFSLNFDDFLSHRFLALFRLASLIVPQIAEDRRRQIEQLSCGGKRFQKLPKSRFDLIASNRLAIARATGLATEVIRIVLTLGTLRKIRGHGMVAIRTGEEPTKRKGFVDIYTHRSAVLAVQPLLNAGVCFEADKRLVLSLPHVNAPLGQLQITRIERLGQHDLHALDSDDATFPSREQRLRFKKAFHFRLRFEATARETFKGFGHNGSYWLVAIH